MQFESTFWKIFSMPGRFILWDRYMCPPKGKVFQTARQRRDPFFIIMYSIVGWLFIGYLLSSFVIGLFIYFVEGVPDKPELTTNKEPVSVQTPAPQKSSSSLSVRNQVF